MSAVIQRLAQHHPKIIGHGAEVNVAEHIHNPQNRKLDLMIGASAPIKLDDDIHAETLFEESYTVVTGAQSPWARRRKITFA